MPSRSELKLTQFINDDSKYELQEILARTQSPTIKDQEFQEIIIFLINSGFFSKALLLMEQELESQSFRFKWTDFTYLISHCSHKLNSKMKKALASGLKAYKDEDLRPLFTVHGEPDFLQNMSELRFTQYREMYLQKKQQLFDKLNFVRNQRLIGEEQKVIQQLKRSFPKDPRLLNIESEFKERWADEVLSKVLRYDLNTQESKTNTEFDKKEESFLTELFKFMNEQPQGKHKNFAIGLIFIGDYTRALKMLNSLKKTRENNWWLMTEVFFLDGQYLECLHRLEQAEVKKRPEAQDGYAINYLKARCLNKLGSQQKALEILNTIEKYQPGYRSTKSIILDVKGEL